MQYYFPVFASFLNATSAYIEKILYRDRAVKPRNFIPMVFFFAFLFSAILIFPFWGRISPEGFSTKNIAIFLLVVILAILMNYLYYYGFCREKLSEVELWVSASPLVIILLSGLVYPSERDIGVFIAGVIAGFALIFAHWSRRGIKISRGSWALIGSVLVGAAEALLVKYLLEFYSAAALYTIRIGLIAIFTILIFGPPFAKLKSKQVAGIALDGFLWVLTMILVYSSYKNTGLVFTTLVLMLSQVLIYLESFIVFREKLTPRLAVAIFLILACVVYAEIIK